MRYGSNILDQFTRLQTKIQISLGSNVNEKETFHFILKYYMIFGRSICNLTFGMVNKYIDF